MCSKNTKIYARYYLLLEKCIKYFNDYQNLLKEKYIIKHKNKIDKLKEKINKILEDNKQMLKINKKICFY